MKGYTRIKYLLISLLSISISLTTSQTKLANSIDNYFYDILLRNIPASHTGSPDVAIIGITNESLKEIKEPLIHWLGYFASVIEALTDAGAKAIIFDIIPAVSLGKLAPEMDIHFIKAIRKAKNVGTPVFLGFKAGADSGQMPHPKFMFQATNLGFLNLFPDHDQKIRRQTLWYTDDKNSMVPSISLLAAMAYSGEVDMKKSAICEKFNICNGNASIRIDYRIKHKQNSLNPFHLVLKDSEESNLKKLKKEFGGKVVFIGMASDKLSDNHPVPLNPMDATKKYVSGLIIQAQTMLSILSPFHFKDVSYRFRIGAIVIISLLVCIFIFISAPKRLLIISPILIIFLTVIIAKAFSNYLVIPASPIILGILIPAAIAGSYVYAVEYGQFRTLRKYFKSYVNSEVMKEIIENPDSVHFEGDLVNISIMFTDIRNFTTLSERLKADEVLKGLNKYLTEMSKTIISADGYVNRYLGDGILALFGAPNNLPKNGALAAVKCGLEMLSRLDELNKNEIFPGLDEIKIGIGIHTGQVMVGNVGCFEKMDYTVIGDSANLASRIESLTKSYNTPLLISESTYELVKNYINIKYVDCVKVKGKKQEVKIYHVLSLKEEEGV